MSTVDPTMARLLEILPSADANGTAAFWLFQSHGRFGGKNPAEVFHEHSNDAVSRLFLGHLVGWNHMIRIRSGEIFHGKDPEVASFPWQLHRISAVIAQHFPAHPNGAANIVGVGRKECGAL